MSLCYKQTLVDSLQQKCLPFTLIPVFANLYLLL